VPWERSDLTCVSKRYYKKINVCINFALKQLATSSSCSAIVSLDYEWASKMFICANTSIEFKLTVGHELKLLHLLSVCDDCPTGDELKLFQSARSLLRYCIEYDYHVNYITSDEDH